MNASFLLRPLALTLPLLALAVAPARGASASDYVAFGVKDQWLYGFTSLSTAVRLNAAAPLSFSGNHLATDIARNRLLFTASGTVDYLYAWDLTTQSLSTLQTISLSDPSDIHTSSGGAAFYNGAYYLLDDVNTGQASSYGLTRITFDAAGNVATRTKPYGNTNPAGGLGDLVITPSGILYIHSTGRALWSLDLNNPSATYQRITPIGQTVGTDAGQLLLDAQGRLLTRSYDGFEWIIINPLTGLAAGSVGRNTSVSRTFADLSDGGFSAPIPEPSPGALALLVAAALFLRRQLSSARLA